MMLFGKENALALCMFVVVNALCPPNFLCGFGENLF